MRAAGAACAAAVAVSAAVVVASGAGAAQGDRDGGNGALASASAPAVQSMVVGAGGTVISAPRTVATAAGSVTVGHSRCAVAAATPLAVLANLQRAGGPSFSLQDYGHCNLSARNSGQLFVYRLGGETNHGQDGWEYKVGRVSGTTGAADTSGALGNGRLLSAGERVLWFWCDAFAGGCQRTLEVSASSSVARGGRLSVQVSGYDNEGRGKPVGEAIVTLGSDFASTSSSGQASLIAPAAPGRYGLSAKGRGMVPSFPETIVVR